MTEHVRDCATLSLIAREWRSQICDLVLLSLYKHRQYNVPRLGATDSHSKVGLAVPLHSPIPREHRQRLLNVLLRPDFTPRQRGSYIGSQYNASSCTTCDCACEAATIHSHHRPGSDCVRLSKIVCDRPQPASDQNRAQSVTICGNLSQSQTFRRNCCTICRCGHNRMNTDPKGLWPRITHGLQYSIWTGI